MGGRREEKPHPFGAQQDLRSTSINTFKGHSSFQPQNAPAGGAGGVGGCLPGSWRGVEWGNTPETQDIAIIAPNMPQPPAPLPAAGKCTGSNPGGTVSRGSGGLHLLPCPRGEDWAIPAPGGEAEKSRQTSRKDGDTLPCSSHSPW